MAALAKVFDTIGLLESILYQLGIATLQGVSKSWNTVIKKAEKLQQALFFEPVAGGPLAPDADGGDDPFCWDREGCKVNCKVLQNPVLGFVSESPGMHMKSVSNHSSRSFQTLWIDIIEKWVQGDQLAQCEVLQSNDQLRSFFLERRKKQCGIRDKVRNSAGAIGVALILNDGGII